MTRADILTLLKSSKILHIIAIFFLALAIRVAYLNEIRDNPFFNHLMIDENAYDQWAQRIARGEWLGQEIFYQDPLYPYLLGAVYSVFGRDLFWMRAFQLFIGAVSCALIYLLASSLFDRKVGLLAGALAALYKPFFYFEAMIEKTFLAIFLISLFLLLLTAARPRRSFLLWVAAGFTLGLLALVRANTLALAAGVVVWLLITKGERRNAKGEREERQGEKTKRGRGYLILDFGFWILDWRKFRNPNKGNVEGFKHKLVSTAGFFVGLLLVLGPVCARNHIVGNDIVLVTSQAGQNFYIGNNPANLNGRYQPPLFIRPNPRYEQEDFRARAEIMTGRKLKPSEVSAYWFGEALRFITGEPNKWLRLMRTKARLFWNFYEVPDNQNYYFFSRYSFLLRRHLPDFRIVAALGLTGMALCVPQWRKLSLLYLAVIIYSATVIAFYVFDRYRLPVVPPLIVFAAATPFVLGAMLKQKKYARTAAAGGMVVAFLILLSTHVNPADYYGDDSNAHCRLAAVYQSEGRFDNALAAYQQASKIMPYYWAPYLGMAEIYESKGDRELALTNYVMARTFNPGNPDICARMGHLYYLAGQLDKSAEAYEAASQIDPEWPEPHIYLMDIYKLQGKPELAQAHMRKLVEMGAAKAP
ncbi:MAG: glycosyltransferase family 39 protein [Candidatus Lindowbacteria bacterium]|nr:glycosyltransferase family 39 protein [Candidatus Lindowbacteria bacterium]